MCTPQKSNEMHSKTSRLHDTCTYFFSMLEYSLQCGVKHFRKLVAHQSFMHFKLVTMAVNANVLKWINLQHILLYTLPQVFPVWWHVLLKVLLDDQLYEFRLCKPSQLNSISFTQWMGQRTITVYQMKLIACNSALFLTACGFWMCIFLYISLDTWLIGSLAHEC